MERVREQYQRFPYPPVSALALPSRGQGEGLSFERGARAAGLNRDPRGIRILVAGAGTLEALVVAQANPHAAEVVAVDLSDASLKRLDRRIRFAKFARFFQRMPPVRLVCADLFDWSDGSFDYVVASNVLQHVAEPALMFERLASWVRDDGLMRVVTYPRHSRIWMRKTAAWLRLSQVTPATPNLLQRTREIIRSLPSENPIRSCFESHQEASTEEGLVDAFLHAWEKPLSPLEWLATSSRAGMRLVLEDQTESSRSSFWDDMLPEDAWVDVPKDHLPWFKLQLLDDTLELVANPTLWFEKAKPSNAAYALDAISASDSPSISASDQVYLDRFGTSNTHELKLYSAIRFELAQGLRRSERLLRIPIQTVLRALERDVGPRVTPPPELRTLPGLSIVDYPLVELLKAQRPWPKETWDRLQETFGKARLIAREVGAPTYLDRLEDQAEWLDLRFSPGSNVLSACLQPGAR